MLDDNGPWQVGIQCEKVYVMSSDFKHDAILTIEGDFLSVLEKIDYGIMLCEKLNRSRYDFPKERTS